MAGAGLWRVPGCGGYRKRLPKAAPGYHGRGKRVKRFRAARGWQDVCRVNPSAERKKTGPRRAPLQRSFDRRCHSGLQKPNDTLLAA